MESLHEVLKRNREQAVKLMLDNNITHISITDNEEYGIDADVPCVLLDNHNGEYYETEVTDIKLCKSDIYIKVAITADLSSSVFVDKEGYINDIECLSYSNNEVYNAIEYYCVNNLYFGDKIFKLGKEIKEKFIKLLSDEDERSFTFKDCDMFHTCIGTNEVSIKSIYMNSNNLVILDTNATSMSNAMPQTFLLDGIYLDERYNLLKHFEDCLRK